MNPASPNPTAQDMIDHVVQLATAIHETRNGACQGRFLGCEHCESVQFDGCMSFARRIVANLRERENYDGA